MKIEISNFGPIKEFEADLSKDLIMIYGKNSIGKSYAISAIYLILKNFLKIGDRELYRIINEKLKLDTTILKAFQTLSTSTDSQKEVQKLITDIFNEGFAKNIENSFFNTFGEIKGLKNFKSKKPVFIKLTTADYSLQFNLGKKIQSIITFKKKFFDDMGNHFDSLKKESKSQNLQGRILNEDIIHSVIHQRIFLITNEILREKTNLYFLPASRSGIYTGTQSFYPILAELSKKRGHITQKIEIPALSEPIADYILLLSEIKSSSKNKSQLQDIATLIEEKILKGAVRVDPERNQLIYTPAGSKLDLQMNLTSSMISEISPIVALLRYSQGIKNEIQQGLLRYRRINRELKPLIFIEEPEAHLHPDAQVQLVEIFAELVKAGAKLIITSHSNYMFNKLNNMVIGKTLDTARYAPLILKDTPGGSIGKEMPLDELGAEDENFVDIADALYEEREQILDRINNSPDDN